MEIQNASTTSSKSNQLRNVNTVGWESWKCNFNFNKLVLLIYAWTRWPHVVSHVHCAPQVNILFIPFLIYLEFLYNLYGTIFLQYVKLYDSSMS